MMEMYELTVSQLDAIGRVCNCATENESEYIRFVESEIKGEHNWDKDLAMLSVLLEVWCDHKMIGWVDNSKEN